MTDSHTPPSPARIAFVGGGNMASAIIGGLLEQGTAADAVTVIEPFEPARARLLEQYGIVAQAAADARLADCGLVVWAVKPQTFHDAAAAVAPFAGAALHLSVAAGISSDSIARWLGTGRVVRAMPNTPALVGKGMTGLFARADVSAADRARIDEVLSPTGARIWMREEAQLDAVTALSGSGPAYVFYFLEAMVQAGTEMGLTDAQARELAVGTFAGAAHLAAHSTESLESMRQKVTSKGGTTYAALTAMDGSGMAAAFRAAMHAARDRAGELGVEFGR